MKKQQKIKCVIFDCDGTLIDSEKLCMQAQVDILADNGIEIEYDWLKRHYQGTKIEEILSDIIDDPELTTEQGILDLVAQYRVRCNQLFAERLTPIEGVREVLDTLIKKNIDICIASNAPQEKMAVTLPMTNLNHYFEGKIFSAFDANSWKPEPGLIEFVMNKMSYSKEEYLFIDDSPVGVQAGVRAGVTTLYFCHDALEGETCGQHANLYQIQKLIEVLNFV